MRGCVVLTEAATARALPPLTVCCAVPKGQRADWLAEKLGELGVTTWVPLLTERGIVEPGGNKVERWRRLAESAARQSRSPTVLEVVAPAKVAAVLNDIGPGVVLTTERPAGGLVAASVLYVGPEGGWSERELAGVRRGGGCGFASLGETVLRVETAAIVAAGVVRLGW